MNNLATLFLMKWSEVNDMPTMGVVKGRPSNIDDIREHLKHVDYPVRGKTFIEACANMSDVPKVERDWVIKNLPVNRTYRNADEIIQVLGL